VPEPVFVRLPAPEITPVTSVDVPFPPKVRVFAPNATPPAPAKEPMVSLADRVSVAPEATVTALLSWIAEPPLRVRPPADTVVEPV